MWREASEALKGAAAGAQPTASDAQWRRHIASQQRIAPRETGGGSLSNRWEKEEQRFPFAATHAQSSATATASALTQPAWKMSHFCANVPRLLQPHRDKEVGERGHTRTAWLASLEKVELS